jgi:hypothetical protein
MVPSHFVATHCTECLKADDMVLEDRREEDLQEEGNKADFCDLFLLVVTKYTHKMRATRGSLLSPRGILHGLLLSAMRTLSVRMVRIVRENLES